MFFIVEQPNIRENPVAVSKTNLYIGILLSCCLHALAYLLNVNVAVQTPSLAGGATARAAVLSLELSQAPVPAGKSAVTNVVVNTPPTPPSLVRQAPNDRSVRVQSNPVIGDPVIGDPVIGDPVKKSRDAEENRVVSVPSPAGETSQQLSPIEETSQQPATVDENRLQTAKTVVELPSPLKDPPPAADPHTIATAVTSAMTGQMPLSINEVSRLVSGAEQTPWPDYPAVARRRGWEGTALIGILVSGKGELMDVRLLASSGKAVLDDAAVSALRAWRLPSAADAEPQWFEVPVEFALR